MPDRRPRFAARRGFTLVEVLVVIGIIALLTGMLLAMLFHSKTAANVIRVKSDLALIETALSAYKADFGDYPRFVDPSVDYAMLNGGTVTPGNGLWLDIDQSGSASGTDRGARLLCRALIGPANAGTLSVANPGDDGADGPGFRIRRNMVNGQPTGTVYGPYLQADRFKLVYDPNPPAIGGTQASLMYNAKMLDIYGNPILYYPATPGATAGIVLPAGFVNNINPAVAPPLRHPLYNAFDNYQDATPPLCPTGSNAHLLLDPSAMQYILGDRTGNGGSASPDGQIDNGETAVTTQPYLLWTAGADGVFGFGPDPINPTNGLPTAKFPGQKTDDVCNFDIPADLRK